MMRRRSNNMDGLLPSQQTNGLVGDGSGRGIRMDAPIIRAAKTASSYTKFSYLSIGACIFFIWLGYIIIQNHDASVILSCVKEGCTLQITPPGRKIRKVRLFFDREQLIDTQMVKVDESGEVFVSPTSHQSYQTFSGDATKPDVNGHYESYAILLHPNGKITKQAEAETETTMTGHVDTNSPLKDEQMRMLEKYGSAALTDPDLIKHMMTADKQHDKPNENSLLLPPKHNRPEIVDEEKKTDLPSLKELDAFISSDSQSGIYTFPIRLYNLQYTRGTSYTSMTKIQGYINQRRDRVKIREERGISIPGIILIVVSTFIFLTLLLIGQFSDPEFRFRRSSQTPPPKPKRPTPRSKSTRFGTAYSSFQNNKKH